MRVGAHLGLRVRAGAAADPVHDDRHQKRIDGAKNAAYHKLCARRDGSRIRKSPPFSGASERQDNQADGELCGQLHLQKGFHQSCIAMQFNVPVRAPALVFSTRTATAEALWVSR